jgi:hypothetical protein
MSFFEDLQDEADERAKANGTYQSNVIVWMYWPVMVKLEDKAKQAGKSIPDYVLDLIKKDVRA